MSKERIMITGSEGLIGKVLVNSWKDIYDLVEIDSGLDVMGKEDLQWIFLI